MPQNNYQLFKQLEKIQRIEQQLTKKQTVS